MKEETIVASAFRVHHSKFSYSLAAALLNGLFEHPVRRFLVIPDLLVVDSQISRDSFSASLLRRGRPRKSQEK
jgi:hypothetical protein